MRRTLVLVDGYSLAYRAYHALPKELQTSRGELTNAVYGFTSMIFSVLESEQPDYVIVAFDKGPSFRVREYEAYKAHRPHMPDELRTQMERIRQLLRILRIPIVELENYEADDIIGTLARQAEEAGLEVIIVTGDRDALQLVDEHTTLLTSGRRFSDTIRYTPEKVRERYGLEPAQLLDLKALMGDSSDNIPGVKGIGEKGGIRLLQEFGSLDALYARLDEVPTRYRKKLEAGREMAYLSRELGRIVRDVPVKLDLEAAAQWHHYDRHRLLEWLREMEFHSLVNRIPKPPGEAQPQQPSLFGEEPPAEKEAPPGDYRLVDDEAALAELVERLRKASALTVDTETTSTDSMQAALVGISLTDREGEAWYIPLRSPQGEEVLEPASVRRHLGPLLAQASLPKQGHNLKYDLKVLRRADLPLEGLSFDTMIAEWLINPASPNLGLKNLAWARLGMTMTNIHDLIGKGKAQTTMDAVSLEKVVPYACADADITHRLVAVLRAELEKREQMGLFRDLEMPLIPVLAAMEMAGVKLDLAYLQALSQELAARLAQIEAEIHRLAGEPFNINSTQQLSRILFDKLGLPTRGIRKTKSGFYSTRAGVLEKLRGLHPIVDLILRYRELAKLKSTYVDTLPRLVNPETGRVHTTFNQTGTVTGRLSSSNPNLQNIPIRTEEGRRVRRAFVAEEGWLFVGADYSQIELRVMAHISGDENLIAAFERGEDIHATTAAAIFGVPLEEVSYEQRRIAKAVNFGLIYGQGAYGLAAQIGVTPAQAEAFIERYFHRFPGVRAYMQRIQREATTRGYVETLLHRRRYFPELEPGSRAPASRRQAALRMAINAPIQGTAADIIKLAMLRLHRRLEGKAARMILQVHDELIVEAPQESREETAAIVREAMEGAFKLVVPLKVDLEIGHNWEEMEAIP